MVLVNVSLSLENQSITSGAGVSVSDVESAGGTTNTALFGQLMHAAQGEGGKTLPPTAVAERLGISLEQLQQLLAQLGQEVAQQASAQAAAVARGEDAAVAASASEAPPPEDAEAFLLWLANQQQSLPPVTASAVANPAASNTLLADEQAAEVSALSGGTTAAATAVIKQQAQNTTPVLLADESNTSQASLADGPQLEKPVDGELLRQDRSVSAATNKEMPNNGINTTAVSDQEPARQGQTQGVDSGTGRHPGSSSAAVQMADAAKAAGASQATVSGGQDTGGSATASRTDLAAAIRAAERTVATQAPAAGGEPPPLADKAAGAATIIMSATAEPPTSTANGRLPPVASTINTPPTSSPPTEASMVAGEVQKEGAVAGEGVRSAASPGQERERLLAGAEGQGSAGQEEQLADQERASQRAAEQALLLAAGRSGERAPADGLRGQQWPPLWQQLNLTSNPEASLNNNTESSTGGLAAAGPAALATVDNRLLASAQPRQPDSQSSPLLRHFAADPASALGHQVQLLVARNLEQITVRLDPQELGSMTIQLRLSEQQLNVQFQVVNPHTREMVEQALPRLREMLGEAGIQLGNTQVGQQQQRESQQLAGEGQSRQGSHARGENLAAGEDELATDNQRQRLQRLPNVAAGRLDFYV